jgi:hypothetical protein
MELIIGSIGLIAIMAYLMVNSETWVLKLLLLGLIIGGVSFLGAAGFQGDNCGFETMNATTSSRDTVDYNYARYCAENPSPQSETWLKYTGWVSRLLLLYIVGSMLYQLLEALNKLPKFMRRKRRTESIRKRNGGY